MYSGNEFPKFLRGTPVLMEKQHPYALMEPNSGNQILPADFDKVLSPRQRKIVSDFQQILRGCRTYGQVIDILETYKTNNPSSLGETLHRLIEDENGDFSVGLQLVISAAPEDFEIYLATAFQVPFKPEMFEGIYLENEVGEVDDFSVLAVTATNSMTILAQNCDVANPMVLMGIEAQLSIHDLIQEERWAGVKCELLGGIPPIIVMRRWGILNSTVLIETGVDENEIFSELVERLV